MLVGLFATLGACENSTSPESITSTTPQGTTDAAGAEILAVPAAEASLASSGWSGGIPFGTFRQPTSEFGARFNGAMRNIYPQFLRSELAQIKARGGKVALMMVGPERYYKDASGRFSLSKWKDRMDRFKGVDIDSYINDGTVIGHYLIDEPQDPANWNGQPVPPAVLEDMAQYSKQRWPNMPTIVRTWPDYLSKYSGNYRYLDAAWAQYAAKRFPDTREFIQTNVAKAKAKGLALIVGLNLIDGSPTKGQMSASQVKQYGETLMSDSYPCAFISWQYRESYMTSSVKDAMSTLRNRAESRPSKNCRGG